MRKFNTTFVIAFMGVDGSGKTTLSNKLNKKLKNNYKKIKKLHLRPYLFLTDRRVSITNPHKSKNPRPQVISFIMILIWLFMYRIFFLINLKEKNQLIIFDRYAHDLLIDKIRYKFNLPIRVTQFILKFFPEPDLWVFLNAPIKLIEKRKKELPIQELKRQLQKYMNLSKKKKNCLVINTSFTIEKNISLILRKMKTIVNSK